MSDEIKPWCWDKKFVLCTDENGNNGLLKIRVWKKAKEFLNRIELDK